MASRHKIIDSNPSMTPPTQAPPRRSLWRTACAGCFPFFGCTTDYSTDERARKDRRKAVEISGPRALRPGGGVKRDRRSLVETLRRSVTRQDSSTDGNNKPSVPVAKRPRHDTSLTTLSMDDLHLLETYQSRARAEGWSQGTRSTSRLASLPTTPDLPSDGRSTGTPTADWPSRLHVTPSRDYISLRSGTPLSTVEQTPPPPPPSSTKPSARSPLSAQNPWAPHRSIRHVGSYAEATGSTISLFAPLPLELDVSPLDVQFERLVMDATEDGWMERGSRTEKGRIEKEKGKENVPVVLGEPLFARDGPIEKELPSRPKLVHFATTPSLARYAIESSEHISDEPSSPTPVRMPRVVTPAPRPSAPTSFQRPRTVTPIRNKAPPLASPQKASSRRSSWTQDIRSSIHRDLTPPHPSPRRRSRPDPALFPGVIPYSVSPREIGRRKQEKEWKRYHQLENVRTESMRGSRKRKGWSWSGRSGVRDGLEVDGVRREEEDGWEVLQ